MEEQITYADKEAGNILFEPVKPEHEEFLFGLFKESRPDLIYIHGMPENERDKIIRYQFLIEKQQLKEMYPNA